MQQIVPEDGHLGPKHVVLKVKVEEEGTVCSIIDLLCYAFFWSIGLSFLSFLIKDSR
jgi:hypothetical protein